MIEMVKDKIWDLLKEKEISLAMIYDNKGKILWHKGREIVGKDVYTGNGFCKSYIEESLKKNCSGNSSFVSRRSIQMCVHPLSAKISMPW